MNIMQGALLGLIQGLGEFLPISSSGHLLLARLLLGMDAEDPAFRMLDILLHVGTLIPVAVIFWKDWIDMLAHPIRNRTLLKLFLASLPALAFYLLFDFDLFNSGWFLGVSFLITAVMLLATELRSRGQRPDPEQTQPSVPQAVFMGILQGVGLLPGVSRSGSTIFGGVMAGVTREGAAKFSFMMSAPAIVASLLVEGKHALEEDLFSHLELVPTLAGVAVAAVTGWFAIRFMLKLISKHSLIWFALYMAVLGLAFLTAQLLQLGPIPAFAAEEGMHFLKLLGGN